MTRTSLTFAFALLLQITTSACGDPAPPALPPPLGGSGGSDADSGVLDADVPDGMTGDGAVPSEDRCSDELSGISCQVEEIVGMSDWGLMTAYPPRFCARFRSGDVKCWSNRPGMAFGTNSPTPGTEPLAGDAMPFLPLGAPALRIAARDQVCAWLDTNAMECVVMGGAGNYTQAIAYPSASRITGIAAGAAAGDSWVLFDDATVQQWRRPSASELPVSVPLSLAFSPTQMVSDLVGVNGDLFETSCALSDEGEVYCWGDNAHGTLGQGDTASRLVGNAAPVPLDEPAVQIATQARRVCAILESGALKCWGTAGTGLGQGAAHDEDHIGDEAGEIAALDPVPIGAGREVVQVDMHRDVTCVVLDDGSLKCFGRNVDNVLGQGVTSPDDIANAGASVPPIRLGTGRTVLQVAVAGYASVASQACALLDDHSVKCWGDFMESSVAEMGDELPRIDFGTLSRREKEGYPPALQVIEPLAVTDPEEALVGDTVTVTCQVTPDERTGDGVNPDSVRVRIVDAEQPTVTLLEAPAIAVGDDSYRGTLAGLSALTSGAYAVACVASDNAPMPRTGQGIAPILYDGGPTIEILSPAVDGAILGQRLPINLSIRVEAAPLVLGDGAAAVEDYEVIFAGSSVTMSEAPDGLLQASLDLLSSQFDPPPSGPVLLSVRARSERGVERLVSRQVVIDDVGPTITPTGNAVDGALLRGSIRLRVRVADAGAGVANGSVRAYVAGSTTSVQLVRMGDTFEGGVDTAQYPRETTQLSVLLVAEDVVGNVSDMPITLRIDNVGPMVSLDPPPVREMSLDRTGAVLCSMAFDPVGTDSVNDQMAAPEGAEFRARIEDVNPLEGNGVVAQVAGIDNTRVAVFILADATRPLLIDTDADGLCDAINDEAVDLELAKQRSLEPAVPAGASFYPADLTGDLPSPAWDSQLCTLGEEENLPGLRCAATSPLTRIIKASRPGETIVPAIYGLAAVDVANCVGRAWDWRLDFPNGGPACVAARAFDTLGNPGVSPALRVCLRRTSGPGYDCVANTAWQNRDCNSGTYRGQTVSCIPPADFEAGYVHAGVY